MKLLERIGQIVTDFLWIVEEIIWSKDCDVLKNPKTSP